MSIARISEVHVRPGRMDEFLTALHGLVDTFPERFAGFEGDEILIDRADPLHLIYRSTWSTVDAVRAYAGDGWATDPVTFPGEAELLDGPMLLTHFDVA